MLSKINIKDCFGLIILTIGLISTSSVSTVSEGTPLMEELNASAGTEEIFGQMVSEDEKPLFGKAELNADFATSEGDSKKVFEKILLKRTNPLGEEATTAEPSAPSESNDNRTPSSEEQTVAKTPETLNATQKVVPQ